MSNKFKGTKLDVNESEIVRKNIQNLLYIALKASSGLTKPADTKEDVSGPENQSK